MTFLKKIVRYESLTVRMLGYREKQTMLMKGVKVYLDMKRIPSTRLDK